MLLGDPGLRAADSLLVVVSLRSCRHSGPTRSADIQRELSRDNASCQSHDLVMRGASREVDRWAYAPKDQNAETGTAVVGRGKPRYLKEGVSDHGSGYGCRMRAPASAIVVTRKTAKRVPRTDVEQFDPEWARRAHSVALPRFNRLNQIRVKPILVFRGFGQNGAPASLPIIARDQ